ncbi:MAG: alpha/beta fold hydrolase [Chloroflexota bacterium]|nr:alpha/beta fold hydrolase [Dehalococcoidia bacterium]MDW8254014.1 alpha/beta fold hydrolase [Chloroflexota bacterium]
MWVDVVFVRTADGLDLPAGFLPPRGPAAGTAADAIIVNGGTGSTFYSRPIFGVAPHLADAGFAVLSLSTRGHSIVWKQLGRAGYFGSAFEILADCSLDFTAAIAFLADRGYSRIAILGHSNGGVKAIYYAAHAPDPRLAAVISCSGPRFSARWYEQSEHAEEYRRNLARARALAEAGDPFHLFELTFPTEPLLRSGPAYLDKYGGETYNFELWADRIRVPLLRITGEHETNVNQRGVAEDLMRLAVNSPHRKAVVLPGAGHRYTPAEEQLVAELTAAWLRSLPSAG